jgi:hypothetical protein
MTSLLNFIKIYQLVPKLLGEGTQTDSSDLINLTFLFEESRLKMALYYDVYVLVTFNITT